MAGRKEYDAVVIGSGPNGLSAAVELARQGAKVLVVEASETIGGGTRTAQLTLPGYRHDVCAAVHPTGYLSPYWQRLPLQDYGLEWIFPNASVAHPLDDEPAVLLSRSVSDTSANLGMDAAAWENMVRPFLDQPQDLIKDTLGPLSWPENPFLLARFGLKALLSARALARWQFRGHRARALLAGCAAHSTLPLEKTASAAIGLLFAIIAHLVDWPIARGGSTRITEALAAYFRSLGGEIKTQTLITQIDQLPTARVYLFDTDPKQLAEIAGDKLPAAYLQRLRNFHYGPAIFKVDWALDGPIPWADPRCLQASTVHIGGTLEEIALSERMSWNGQHSDRPYLILCQQSEFDDSRAPSGKHTGYAYCHVPFGSTVDMTDIIEQQVERFAPGFRDRILAKYTLGSQALYRYNRNLVGGTISGGSNDLSQLFTRPVVRWDPYTTPHPQIFICSSSTPPGGGVHGMCGYHAACSVLRRW